MDSNQTTFMGGRGGGGLYRRESLNLLTFSDTQVLTNKHYSYSSSHPALIVLLK